MSTLSTSSGGYEAKGGAKCSEHSAWTPGDACEYPPACLTSGLSPSANRRRHLGAGVFDCEVIGEAAQPAPCYLSRRKEPCAAAGAFRAFAPAFHKPLAAWCGDSQPGPGLKPAFK